MLKKVITESKAPGYFYKPTTRVGFVRLADSAAIILADEYGIFKKYGLRVELSREVGWASIRDKMINRELELSQALGPMPFSVTLGLGNVMPVETVTSFVSQFSGECHYFK